MIILYSYILFKLFLYENIDYPIYDDWGRIKNKLNYKYISTLFHTSFKE